MKRLRVLTGGPWHPLDDQVRLLRSWLAADWQLEAVDGALALEDLEACDLFVVAGMHWPALDGDLPALAWERAGRAAHPYLRPTPAQRQSFRAYVASGRPLLAIHGGILCFEDWPEFGRWLGFRWHWGYTGHSVYDRYPIHVATTAHPVVAGVTDFSVEDELYFNVVIPAELRPEIHARAHFAPDVDFPMALTAEGGAGRLEGAGRTAYLANGHSMDSLAGDSLRRLWTNTIDWLLEA